MGHADTGAGESAYVRFAVRRGYRGRTVPAQYDVPMYARATLGSRRGVIRDPAASKWPAAFRRSVYGESTLCLFDPRSYQTSPASCESAVHPARFQFIRAHSARLCRGSIEVNRDREDSRGRRMEISLRFTRMWFLLGVVLRVLRVWRRLNV